MKLGAELKPDVMVLDIMLPKMNRIQVLRQLNDWTQAPAVVMCSMLGEILNDALTLGASVYGEKPAAVETPVETIRRVAKRVLTLTNLHGRREIGRR